MTIPIKLREPKVELKPKTLIMDKQHTIMDVSIFMKYVKFQNILLNFCVKCFESLPNEI